MSHSRTADALLDTARELKQRTMNPQIPPMLVQVAQQCGMQLLIFYVAQLLRPEMMWRPMQTTDIG